MSGSNIGSNIKILFSTNGLTADRTFTFPDANTLLGAGGVNADWNAIAGMGVLLNKPTIPTTTAQIAATTAKKYVIAYLVETTTLILEVSRTTVL